MTIKDECERFLHLADEYGRDMYADDPMSADEQEELKAVFFRGAIAALDMVNAGLKDELSKELREYGGDQVRDFIRRRSGAA